LQKVTDEASFYLVTRENAIKNMEQTEKTKYSTLQQAKNYFEVSDSTIRGWLRAGCPALKISTQYRVKIDEVEQWLKGKSHETAETTVQN